MTIGIVAKLKVAPGKNAEFEEIFSELARATRKGEPGNNFYALHKSKTDPQTYVVLENYKDQAAVDAHMSSPHFQAGFKKWAPALRAHPKSKCSTGCD
jgi:quinol monooxygenase YgiN